MSLVDTLIDLFFMHKPPIINGLVQCLLKGSVLGLILKSMFAFLRECTINLITFGYKSYEVIPTSYFNNALTYVTLTYEVIKFREKSYKCMSP